MNKYTSQTKSGTSTTTSGGSRRVKTEGYRSATLHAKRDRKRQEAEARQRECDSRTLKERMDLCRRRPGRPGDSSREFKRLQVLAERERTAKA